MYGNSYICPYLRYLISAFIRLLIFVHFFVVIFVFVLNMFVY